ncbi:DedA family protein [Epidermidibacterium keratini]|uniref:DedA family protein n=2 Tax=Epidermidibacterium keratini TaxID=1891644 RepID=A0A7L4YT68_9ACTN|nr:DedA family protein [Epidermidibacterium keratini]
MKLGPWVVLGVCAILFAECGLLVGFFLPGDTLLFFTGIFHASGIITTSLWLLFIYMVAAAFAGNMVGYGIGYKLGPAVFSRPDARLLKPEYIERSAAMFEKYGKPAVVLSRFVPVVRTITPPMAGASKMHGRIYALYSFLGGILWVVSITLLGIWLGQVAFIRENLDLIIVGAVAVVVLATAGPAIWHLIERRRRLAKMTPQQRAAERAQIEDRATVEAPDELGGYDPEKHGATPQQHGPGDDVPPREDR